MWVRATRLRSAPSALGTLIDEFITVTAPKVKAIDGNVGAVLAVNREEGRATALTYWRDRAALDASETAATGLRTATAAKGDATVESVERLEQVLIERVAPSEVGHFIRANRFRADPARADEGIENLRQQTIPTLRTVSGFRAVVCGIDRESGRAVISTTWDSLDALRASEAAVSSARQETMDHFGATDLSIQILESVYLEIQTPATLS
jgi:quinol monooxygenase YgiN